MINVNEIIEKHFGNNFNPEYPYIKLAMIEFAEKLLEMASEKALIHHQEQHFHKGNIMGDEFDYEFDIIERDDNGTDIKHLYKIDKKSITELINQIK